MTSGGPRATRTGLLIDSNLLVLLAVGAVNPDRIETFKRTRQYTKADYELLTRVIESFDLYTVPHVLAEVSNLTDLPGPERLEARRVLKETISLLNEVKIASSHAAEDGLYEELGLVDAAIGALAREHDCAVLTDDMDLYLRLTRDQVDVLNFTHLRARVVTLIYRGSWAGRRPTLHCRHPSVHSAAMPVRSAYPG